MMDDGRDTSIEPSLSSLADDYEIIGELGGRGDVRTYLARRRDTGADVMIAVVHATTSTGNNALAHFASDANTLGGGDAAHPGLLHVLEGRWIDGGTFAVVSERPRGATVRELLSAGTRFTNARVAVMLQEINGVLEWAREHGIVHRGASLDAAYLEPGTARLQVALRPTPIPTAGVPNARDDARVIGTVAWELLAGLGNPPDENEESLTTLRPDLPERVVVAAERLRGAADDDHPPDVASLIALVATADVLREAEDDRNAHRAAYAELQRVQRELWQAERAACDRRVAEADARLAAERAEFERGAEARETALASDRAQLEAERAQLDYETVRLESLGRLAPDGPDRGAIVERAPAVSRTVAERRRPRIGLQTVVAVVVILLVLAFEAGRRNRAVSSAFDVATAPPVEPVGRVPRGGFLTQSANGSLAPRSGPPIARSDVIQVDTVRADTVRRDTARVDTTHRIVMRDTTHRDTLPRPRPDTLVRDTTMAPTTTTPGAPSIDSDSSRRSAAPRQMGATQAAARIPSY